MRGVATDACERLFRIRGVLFRLDRMPLYRVVVALAVNSRMTFITEVIQPFFELQGIVAAVGVMTTGAAFCFNHAMHDRCFKHVLHFMAVNTEFGHLVLQ